MRILLIARGGIVADEARAVPCLIGFVTALAARFDVTVASTWAPTKGPEREFGARRVVLRGSIVDQARQLRALGRFDVVHALSLGLEGRLGVFAAGRTPLVATIWGGERVYLPEIGYGGAKTATNRWASALVMRRAARIVAPSHFVAPVGATVIPWFSVESGSAVSTPVGNRVVSVADLIPVKDPLTLVDAVARVPDLRLEMFGADGMGGSVQRRARDLGISARVLVFGQRPHREIAEHLRGATAFLQASRHESQGVALCEAAALGIPAVGTAVGLLPELAAAGGAITVGVGDVDAFAAGIRRVVADSKTLGERAHAFIAGRGPAWTAAQYASVYAEVAR